MFNKIKMLSFTACAVFLLQSCHSDDDALYDLSAPREVAQIDAVVYSGLRETDVGALTAGGKTQAQIDEAVGKTASINSLFKLAAVVAGRVDPTQPPPADPDDAADRIGTEPCQVKLHKMEYNTVGGAGEATNATGVVMVPYSDVATSECNNPRPVVLYAHGTNADRNYDLSKIVTDPSNAANQEGMVMLALYAAEGYVVIAPNYAGYADSALSYHPYVDEKQQSTDMIDALEHVRKYAGHIGANLSSKLFVTGMSQGGYVAMATHKALQAKGETVTGSLTASGPYVISKFLDTVMGGYVNYGATTFAPMYLTALDRAHDIYDDTPTEVYAVDGADNIFPNPGANSDGFPSYALFAENSALITSTTAPQAFSTTGPFILGFANSTPVPGIPFDTKHVIAETLRTQYLAAASGSSTDNVGYKIRELAKQGDLNNWAPSSPLVMCGASNDPVVYFDLNSKIMADYWSTTGANPSPYASMLDLTATPAGPLAGIQMAWQSISGSLPASSIHETTTAYCAGAGLGLFNSL